MSNTVETRIRDRLDDRWLTPSQKAVWEAIQRFDGPPHRVINIYGTEGTGKTFMGWFLERMNYATYSIRPDMYKPLLSRLTLDNVLSDRTTARELRPLVDKYDLQQIILLTRIRVDERAMPTFELRMTEDDYRNYKIALDRLS